MTYDCDYCRTRYQAERCPSCGAPPTATTSTPGVVVSPGWITNDMIYGIQTLRPEMAVRVKA